MFARFFWSYLTKTWACIKLSLLEVWNLTLVFHNKSCITLKSRGQYRLIAELNNCNVWKQFTCKIEKQLGKTVHLQIHINPFVGGLLQDAASLKPCNLYVCVQSALAVVTYLLRNQLWPPVLQTSHEISGFCSNQCGN